MREDDEASVSLTEMEATRLILAQLPAAGHARDQIAVEAEWLVVDRKEGTRVVTVAEGRAAVGRSPLPAGGVVTFEPGGQLEVSTKATTDPDELVERLEADTREVAARLEPAGLAMVPLGRDPLRPPVASLDLPRYRLMRQAFDRQGPSGAVMMCSTASLQVNIDPGRDAWSSWVTLSRWAPVIAALFANSPTFAPDSRWSPGGRGTGLAPGKSFPSPWGAPTDVTTMSQRRGSGSTDGSRMANWWLIDPSRTAPVPVDGPDRWVDYVFGATLLFRADSSGDLVAAPGGTTFREWLAGPGDFRRPDATDLARHLSTLFPPVRPRRWLEVRMIDAVPETVRSVVVGVVWALLHDDELASRAMAAPDGPGGEGLPGRDGWRRGSWRGLPGWEAAALSPDHPAIQAAGGFLLDRAVAVLDQAGIRLGTAVRRWRDGPFRSGLSPARISRGRFNPEAPGWSLAEDSRPPGPDPQALIPGS